jgi:hypothetical protein
LNALAGHAAILCYDLPGDAERVTAYSVVSPRRKDQKLLLLAVKNL